MNVWALIHLDKKLGLHGRLLFRRHAVDLLKRRKNCEEALEYVSLCSLVS